MSNNSYNDIKNGIKSDIRGIALNAFGGLGAFTLILAMLLTLGFVFYKANEFSSTTKTITGISFLILTGLLIFNKRVANAIFTGWLLLLCIVLMLLMVGIVVGFGYLLFKPMVKDFF